MKIGIGIRSTNIIILTNLKNKNIGKILHRLTPNLIEIAWPHTYDTRLIYSRIITYTCLEKIMM